MKTGMRATQLADAMDPFTLEEALHRATMPFEYVHRAESRRLEREEEADKIWRARTFTHKRKYRYLYLEYNTLSFKCKSGNVTRERRSV